MKLVRNVNLYIHLLPLVILKPIVNWVAMVCHFEKVGQLVGKFGKHWLSP